MRPAHQRPGLLESILHRPYKVECWACFHVFWLDRGQAETPWDWTCPDCMTRQRRDQVPDHLDAGILLTLFSLEDGACY